MGEYSPIDGPALKQAKAAFSRTMQTTVIGTMATLLIDDVLIDDVAVLPSSVVYDAFGDSVYDGSYDEEKWLLQNRDGACTVEQHDGVLTLLAENRPSANLVEGCTFHVIQDIKNGVSGKNLNLFGAKMKVVKVEGSSGQVQLIMHSGGFSEMGGYMSCGIKTFSQTRGFFAITTTDANGVFGDEYLEQRDISRDDWHTLQFLVNPTDMKVSCSVDGEWIGEPQIPRDAKKLIDSNFTRYIQVYIAPDTLVAYAIDDVQVLPLAEME